MGAAGAARAQTPPEIPPPAAYNPTDANGVNLYSGSYSYTTPVISIGQPGQGGLSYSATFDTSVGEWRNSTAGMVVEEPFIGPPALHRKYTVTVMGVSNVFLPKSGGYRVVDGDGALSQTSGDFTYTALDGSIAEFLGGVTYSPVTANKGLISSLTRPNGEKLSFTYTSVTMTGGFQARRIQSVTNNLGYQIHFQYGSNTWGADWYRTVKVTALNNAVDYCAPTANTCTFSRTWPSLTFAQTSTEKSVTDALGRTTRLLFPGGWLSGIRRPTSSSGQNITLTRDLTGERTASVSDGAGAWSYTYVPPPVVTPPPVVETSTTTVRNSLNESTVVSFTSTEVDLGVTDHRIMRVASVKNALNQTTSYSYTPEFRLFAVTYPEGNKEQYSWAERGELLSVTRVRKPGSSLTNTTISATLTPGCLTNPVRCGRPATITDARGEVTSYTYDPTHGGLLTVTRPLPTGGTVQPQTRYAYASQYAWFKNSAGALTPAASPVWLPIETSACATLSSCNGLADEVQSTTAYQVGSTSVASNLLPVSVSTGSGNGALTATTTTVWEPTGDARTIDGPLSGAADTTRYVWDVMRQSLGEIRPDPDGAGSLLYPATRTTYNADGQVTTVEAGATTGQTDAAWAAFSPLQTSTTVYNAQARKIRDTAAAGTADASVTQYAYDAAGRLICTTQRMNPAVFGALPASACTLGVTGFFGPDRITFNSYDKVARLLSTTSGYLSGAPITESQTWTTNGKIATRTDGKGNVSTYVYDGFDRVSRLRFPNASGGGSSTTDHENYNYDAADNPTDKWVRSGALFTTSYDALNRPTAIDAPAGTNDVAYAYDNLDRMLTASIPGQTITRAWDALGRMTSETGPLGTMSYQYDLAGRRTRQTWPDAFFVTNTWNLANEMTATLHAGTTQIIGYSYDNLSRRTGITRGNGVTSSYGYDGASRLTSLSHNVGGTAADVTFGYAYNPAGQIVIKTVSNNAYVHSPTAAATAYVNNGLNRVTSVGGAGVSYDANGNITHDATRAFTYDAANRLTGANGGTSTLSYDPLDRLDVYVGTYGGRHIYDGTETVGFAAVGSTTLQNRFIRGPDADEIVANYTTGSVPAQYWTADERGSLINLSGSTGASTIINTYDEYGQPAPTNLGRLQYTGQLWMPDFGAYHYKARAYQPGIGRFLQTDPVGYEAGLNLYAYVANDPVNKTDPTGMFECWTCLGGERVQNPNGTVTIRSNQFLRVLVPGQVAWDNARTNWANGDRVGAAISATAMLGEQAAVVLTAGASSQAGNATRAATASVQAGNSAATQTAMQGGRHAGFLNNISGMSNSGLNRTIGSLERQIAVHEGKIANPGAYMKRGDPSNPSDVARAVRDWRREIDNYGAQRDIAEDILRSRQ